MQTKIIQQDDNDIRLDRWFKRYYPNVTHGLLQKLLRDKNIKVDGKKAAANTRLLEGQELKFPDFPDNESQSSNKKEFIEKELSQKDIDFVQSLVIYKDDNVIAINKPQGLPVQSGSGIVYHLDMLLPALKFEKKEKPKLVHRLDKETSGVLILARNSQTASYLANMFKVRESKKIYWALVKGVPKVKQGKISFPLFKKEGKNGFERVVVDEEEGLPATTFYRLVENAGKDFSFVELCPKSGRTHQLRVHLAEIGNPIVGDDKYWPRELEINSSLANKLHLHAKALIFKSVDGKNIAIEAPLPVHIKNSFDDLGFDYKNMGNSFSYFDEVIKKKDFKKEDFSKNKDNSKKKKSSKITKKPIKKNTKKLTKKR